MIVWLTRRGARIAHLDQECEVLARRPKHLPAPIATSAERLPKGLVQYHRVRNRKVVLTQARLCWMCMREWNRIAKLTETRRIGMEY